MLPYPCQVTLQGNHLGEYADFGHVLKQNGGIALSDLIIAIHKNMSTEEIRHVVTKTNNKTYRDSIYVLKNRLYKPHDMSKCYTLDNVETLYFMKPKLAYHLNLGKKINKLNEQRLRYNPLTRNEKVETSAITLKFDWDEHVLKGKSISFYITADDGLFGFFHLQGRFTPKYIHKRFCKKYPAARGMRMYTFDGVNYNPVPANVTFEPTTNKYFFLMTPQEAKRLTVIAKANVLRDGAARAKEAKAEHKRSLPPKQAAKHTGRNIQIPKLTSGNVQAILDGDIL